MNNIKSKTLVCMGDVHGKTRKLIQKYSKKDFDMFVQVGDLGFKEDYDFLRTVPNFDKFYCVPGNHDEYPSLSNYPWFLSPFGYFTLNNHVIFFMKGAYSIDKDQRISGVDWWPEEEVSWEEANRCLDLYESLGSNIDFVISHSAPQPFHDILVREHNPTNTTKCLYEMLKIHAPKHWIFGHYHMNKTLKDKSTGMQCHCLDINMTKRFEFKNMKEESSFCTEDLIVQWNNNHFVAHYTKYPSIKGTGKTEFEARSNLEMEFKVKNITEENE